MNSSISLIIFVTINLFVSCQIKEKDEKLNPQIVVNKNPLNDKIYIDSLLERSWKGDTVAYQLVIGFHLGSRMEQELLNLSVFMAHEYHYNYAFFCVYHILVRQKKTFEELNPQTKNLALYYLIRSYELGFKESLVRFKGHYGKEVPLPKSKYYLDKMAKFDLEYDNSQN